MGEKIFEKIREGQKTTREEKLGTDSAEQLRLGAIGPGDQAGEKGTQIDDLIWRPERNGSSFLLRWL